jgi:hypothetical protein
MGHELNHVAIHYFNLPKSEAFCYNWNFEVCMENNRFYEALLYMQVALKQAGIEKVDMRFIGYDKYGDFGIPFVLSGR